MDYISIRVATLRGDQKIGFNTYLKINEKMVLYLKKGDSFEGIRLNKLKEKKLRKMFIAVDEENSYIDYLEKNINMAYDNKSLVDIQTRAEIIQGDQQSKARPNDGTSGWLGSCGRQLRLVARAGSRSAI